MRRTTLLVAGLLVLAAGAPTMVTATAQTAECSFPMERTDLTGETIALEEAPERVVTLNPSAAQTMWEIGAQDRVVGVTQYATNLNGSDAKTNVSGAGQTINNEEVVDLEPDLVIAPNTVSNDTVDALREAGLTVYKFPEAESIADVVEKTRTIGELVGECEGAEETVSWMEEELAAVDEATEDREPVDAMYVFFGFTSGNGTFIDGLIERAGANNLAAEAGIEGYQEVNQEVIVDQNPEWFVLNSDDPSVPATPAYNGTTAVQQNQTVVVNTNHFNRPAPRVIHTVTAMAAAFHGDAYDAAAAPADDSSTSGPGFGVASALAAVAVVGLLLRRR